MFATLWLALVLFSGQAVTAQSTAAAAIAQAPGPADCVPALQTFVSKRQQEVRTPSGFTSELLRQVNDEKIALAKSCLARFDAATIKPAQLAGLADLYISAGQQQDG